jgi:hypothetical protein
MRGVPTTDKATWWPTPAVRSAASRLLVAQVVLALGFLLFLGYPAVVKVLSA